MFNTRTVNRIVTALAAIVMLALVTGALTLVYWAGGGKFERGESLVIYLMVLFYLWALTFKIARERHIAENKKDEDQGCQFCGFKTPK